MALEVVADRHGVRRWVNFNEDEDMFHSVRISGSNYYYLTDSGDWTDNIRMASLFSEYKKCATKCINWSSLNDGYRYEVRKSKKTKRDILNEISGLKNI